MSPKAKRLIEYCQQDYRISPKPDAWSDLWNMLPNKVDSPDGWQPDPPVILAAWSVAPGLMKLLRLEAHIKWADEHGAIDKVDEFLRSLPENKWFKA